MKFRVPHSLITLLLLLAPSMAFAQTETADTDATQYMPEPDEFVPVETTPEFDMKELWANVEYPQEARENNIEGMVVVRVLIDKTGKPSKAMVIKSDNTVLEQAAVHAVEKTRFTPAMQNRQPVSVWIMVPVKFVLTE